MEKLFTYGTLQEPAVQTQLLGRKLGSGTADTLRGYQLAKLLGVHQTYRILLPKPGATVQGLVFEVSDAELKKLDHYEGAAYQRVSATLVSDTRAWIYCANPKSNYRSLIEPLEPSES